MKRKFLSLFLTVLVIGVLFVCYGISESSKDQVDQASAAISELSSSQIPARTLVTKVFDNAEDYDAFVNSIWMRQNRYEVFSHDFAATSVVLDGEIITKFYFTVTYFARY